MKSGRNDKGLWMRCDKCKTKLAVYCPECQEIKDREEEEEDEQ